MARYHRRFASIDQHRVCGDLRRNRNGFGLSTAETNILDRALGRNHANPGRQVVSPRDNRWRSPGVLELSQHTRRQNHRREKLRQQINLVDQTDRGHLEAPPSREGEVGGRPSKSRPWPIKISLASAFPRY